MIKLISTEYKQDELLQFIPEEKERIIYCEVQSISRAEWYDAGRNGMKPQIKVITPRINYLGEEKAEYKGKVYAIYRTFFSKGDTIELYLEEKAGISNG